MDCEVEEMEGDGVALKGVEDDEKEDVEKEGKKKKTGQKGT